MRSSVVLPQIDIKPPLAVKARVAESLAKQNLTSLPRLGRRLLLASVGAAALLAIATPARAATATVTYAVNYAGDFTTIAAAFSGIGSNLTATSTGNLTGVSSSSSVVQLSVLEGATDYTGHPLTIGATTCLITSYNTSTKVATVSARAGYTANFGSTPSTGSSYTIADVAVVMNVGQSSAGNNAWSVSSLTLPAITTSSTNSITINGVTPWNNAQKALLNASGSVSQPVIILANGTTTITPANVTINNIQYYN